VPNDPNLENLRKTLYDTVPPDEAAATLGDVNSAGLIVVTQLPEITQRLELVKTQIEKGVAPYEEMEAVYRACVTDVWKPVFVKRKIDHPQ